MPCNGNIQGAQYKYRGPRTTKARLTAADAADLISFNGVLLVPRGWKCNLNGGSGGATLVAYNPRSDFFQSGGGYQPQEAISTYGATPGNHALYQACAFFSSAASRMKQLGLGDCDSSLDPPVGEQRTQMSLGEVDFVDPPGVSGTGNPSGGRNRAIGIELFDERYDNRLKAAIAYAATATCTLAPARRHYCSAILRDVRSGFRATR